MQLQTVDTLLTLLPLLQQPAFCIRTNGTIYYNEYAKHFAPSCAAELPGWLGEGKVLYDVWDRTGNLQFSLDLLDMQYSVTLQPLQDGTLFLLSACTAVASAAEVLSVASQTVRQPLSDLNSILQSMTPENQQTHAAAAFRQLHRMTRIVSNLSELTRLVQPSPRMYVSAADTETFLRELLDEVDALCKSADRDFTVSLPKKPLPFRADTTLLKRALLNLISNALKFSPTDSKIVFRAESIGTHLVFQVENDCTDNGSELLRSAFSRLSNRDIIPNPKWGLGLGLPLANAIARLHGGMVAVETNNGKATVSLSVSLHRTEFPVKLGSLRADYTGGMRQTLLELSDALPNDLYKR